MSEQRSSSPSPVRRSASQEKDPKIKQGQANALKGMQKRKKKSFLDKYAYHLVIGGFLILCASALFSIFFSKSKKAHLVPVIDEEDIQSHNADSYSFTLGPNSFFDGYKLSDAKTLFNNQFSFKPSLMRCASDEGSSIIEDNYDFRKKFPQCVNKVYNQGNCSSSYAIASASALSNRFCINGEQVTLSPQEYLSCDPSSKKCEGGAIASFLDHAKKDGLVEEDCVAYKGDQNATCPEHVKECQRHFVLDFCVSSTPEIIKREILKNGPVVAIIPAYRDFLIYKDGIYHVLPGVSKFQGGHALKVIGWGKSGEQDYWIVENSWGESWGTNGYAFIAIGEKDLYLDEFVMAATPKTAATEAAAASQPQDSNTESENLDNSQ